MVKEEDEVETDREIAVRGFRLKKKKENERDTSWFGRIDRREGTRDERAKSSDDGRGSSSFLFTLTFSLSLSLCSPPPTRSGLCAFESRGSRGFPGKDVHRFLSSDRPFEQQPT